jgi:hypothetical protein
MDFALLQGMTRTGPPLARPPLMGFSAPPAFEATGSDLHRVCLTRLCCASRFSQPPGALFLPRPFRLCFAPVTLMGFRPAEVSPSTPPGPPLGGPAPPDVLVGRPLRRRPRNPSFPRPQHTARVRPEGVLLAALRHGQPEFAVRPRCRPPKSAFCAPSPGSCERLGESRPRAMNACPTNAPAGD